MKIILFVWKEGVIERFGELAKSLGHLGHEAILALHPRSQGSVYYKGRAVHPKPPGQLMDEHRPDCVVIWNGDLPLDAKVKAHCRRRRIPILYCEMGWFPQAETIYFDWSGVNGSSSIRRSHLAPLNQNQRRELEAFLASYHAYMGNSLVHDGDFEDFILVPLQVETDSNILKYSPIKRMADLIEKVRNIFPDQEILVRPHPKTPAWQQYNLPKVQKQIDPKMPLHALLTRAKAIVGINSTVLMEALAYFKPVIAFGEGIFSGHGVLLEATRSTPRAMREFVEMPLDAWRREKVASFLYELIFQRSVYNRDLGNPGKIQKRRFYLEILKTVRKKGATR